MTYRLVCLLSLVVSSAVLAEGVDPPRVSPVIHWEMRDSAGASELRDSSGNGCTATLEGAIQAGEGREANAVRFSGVRAGLGRFMVPAFKALTLTAWVNVTGMGQGDKPYPRVAEWSGGFLHVTREQRGGLNLTFRAGGGHWTSSGWPFAPNQWAHIAVTYNGDSAANEPTFYVNGQATPYAVGRPPEKPVNFPGGDAFLGNNGAQNRPFEGLMSDVRFYNDVLSADAIARLARVTPDGDPPADFVQLHKDGLPIIDLSKERQRHVVIAAGTTEVYQGHATTVLLPDGKTMFAVWSYEHGGACGPMARSDDAGRTWTRIDEILPDGFAQHRNCPSIYRIVDRQGTARLWVFSGGGRMGRLMSEDDGRTWVEMPPLVFHCGMPFTGMIRLKDGRTAAFGQRRVSGSDQGAIMSVTSDGGMTWPPPHVVAQAPGKNLCEPFVLRSPDGEELCMLMRENRHTATSMMCFSRDEGDTWSAPQDTSWGLTGDRHEGVQAADGRWVIAFRDRALHSSTYGQFVAWVGSYDDIRHARPGDFRIKLLHHYGSPRDGYGWAYTDTGYPGMELLPDGTIVATTYTKYWDDERRHSVVSTRFKLSELGVEGRRP